MIQFIQPKQELKKEIVLYRSPSNGWPLLCQNANERDIMCLLDKGKCIDDQMADAYQKLCEEPTGKSLADMPVKQLFRTEDQDAIVRHDTFHEDIPGLNDADVTQLGQWLKENGIPSGIPSDALLENLRGHLKTQGQFWANIYKVILLHFAHRSNDDFHDAVRKHLGSYGETWLAAPIKTFERIRVKELEYGVVGAEHYSDRTTASRILDINRGSLTVRDPAEMLRVMDLIESWTVENTGMCPVLRKNGFSNHSCTDYRDVKYIVLYRPSSGMPLLCEIRLLLPVWDTIASHDVYRVRRGDSGILVETAEGKCIAKQGLMVHDGGLTELVS